MTDTAVKTQTGTSVTLKNVVKEFGHTQVLHGIDLEVHQGEFVSLLGPSGCGKTTVLRLIAGLETLTSGTVMMNDSDVSDVPTNKRDIGMVFQAYSLFPHLSALNNTMFGLQVHKVPPAEAKQRAMEALDMVGLADLADRYPHALSGGQQQRIALARALVTSPRVLLLDEPLSALDAQVRVQLRVEIRRIQQDLGITTIFVTHDQEEALAISDRIAVMSAGRIEQVGSPEQLYLTPANPVVAAFVGISSLVKAHVQDGYATVWGIQLPVIDRAADGDCEVFIRPEQVRVANPGEPGVDATVTTSTFLGPIRRTIVRAADGQLLTMQHAADQVLDRGTNVRVTITPVPVAVRTQA